MQEDKLLIAGLLVALALLVVSIYPFLQSKPVEEKLPSLKIIQLKDPSCRECSDLGQLVSTLVKSGASVERQTILSNSTEGGELVSKYGIKRLPSLVVTGEVDEVVSLISAWSTLGTRESDGTLILRNPVPPFVENGRVTGLVEVIQLTDSSCSHCGYVLSKRDFEANGVLVGSERSVEFTSQEGIGLITKYNVTKIPAFILSSDVSLYPKFVPYLTGIGSFEKDGFFVQRTVNPPYRDLREGKMRGVFNLKFVYDKRCEQCPGPGGVLDFLSRNYGMKPELVEWLEASQDNGASALQGVNSTILPVFLLAGDVEPYGVFQNALPGIGRVANGSVLLTNYSVVFARTSGNLTLFDSSKNVSIPLR